MASVQGVCGEHLANAAGIHHNTVKGFEVWRYAGSPETLAAIRKALRVAGVEFTNSKASGCAFGDLMAAGSKPVGGSTSLSRAGCLAQAWRRSR